LQNDYDEDARRLMEVRTNQQNLERQGEEIEMLRGQLEKEIREQGQKIERSQRTYG
jgi:hypothetical protein